MSMIFIGIDAGGTGTRALAATAEGAVVGRGRAAGANAWSSGSSPAEAISAAALGALGDHDPASVASGVIAVAGAVSSVPGEAAAVLRAWQELGIAAKPRIILDVVAAYAAGTPLPRGLVLTAGTGAIAAFIDEGEPMRRTGGRGWLVGDEGSAVWLGVEGVRAALHALDDRGPATVLSTEIPGALGVAVGDPDVATAITDAVYGRSPAELGQLAPLIVRCAEAGDGVAAALVAVAADHLAATAVAAAGDERPPVVVLAGSLLTRVPTIGGPVRASLGDRWPEAAITESVSGEAGAVALAIRWHSGMPVSAAVHEALRAGATD